MTKADCTSCHNPHGSEQKALIRSNAHKVFLSCARCHKAEGSNPQALLATGPDLCFRCHAEKKKALEAKGAHPAAQQDCVVCHTPHASDDRGLGKPNERAICLGCHDDMRKTLADGISIHPVKANKGRCSSCHEPHVTKEPHLLARPREELCRKCHQSHEQFAHPMGKGIVDPNDGRTLSCVSCHAAHASQQPYILLDEPSRALCLRCHTDDPNQMIRRAPGPRVRAPLPGEEQNR